MMSSQNYFTLSRVGTRVTITFFVGKSLDLILDENIDMFKLVKYDDDHLTYCIRMLDTPLDDCGTRLPWTEKFKVQPSF